MFELVGNWGDGDIYKVTSGAFPSNSYICSLNNNYDSVLIDGGLDPKYIESCFEMLNLKPSAVLCTHGHFDHIGSANYFQNKFNLPIYLNPKDKKTVEQSNFLLLALKFNIQISLDFKTTWVNELSNIHMFDTLIEFIEFPGHTPGSSIIKIGNALFTGDSVYANGIGLSGLPGENKKLLKNNILKYWDLLLTNSKFTIYPGHGNHIECSHLALRNKALISFLQK